MQISVLPESPLFGNKVLFILQRLLKLGWTALGAQILRFEAEMIPFDPIWLLIGSQVTTLDPTLSQRTNESLKLIHGGFVHLFHTFYRFGV